jgi:hypothetical protein
MAELSLYALLTRSYAQYDGREAAAWFGARPRAPVCAALAYAAMLALVPRAMAAREPIRLRALTFWWNAALAADLRLPPGARVISAEGAQFHASLKRERRSSQSSGLIDFIRSEV